MKAFQKIAKKFSKEDFIKVLEISMIGFLT